MHQTKRANKNDVLRNIVSESGNSFHCKVVNAFRERGWATLVSSYYIDTATDKSREIDLIAEKSYPVPNNSRECAKSIRVRLYVECKYIGLHVVFWFDSRDDQKSSDWIQRNTPFQKSNTLFREHHHVKSVSSVAKLFASESKRSEDNDPIFRALNQCLNGFVHNRGGELLSPARGNEQITLLEYPVIICSDFRTFYRTDIPKGQDPERIRGNFLLEVNYAFVDKNKANRRDYFLVDVVEYASLDAFVAVLNHEVEHAKLLIGD
jgi:hypothetical protein